MVYMQAGSVRNPRPPRHARQLKDQKKHQSGYDSQMIDPVRGA